MQISRSLGISLEDSLRFEERGDEIGIPNQEERNRTIPLSCTPAGRVPPTAGLTTWSVPLSAGESLPRSHTILLGKFQAEILIKYFGKTLKSF